MKPTVIIGISIAVILGLMAVEPAIAGPGGKIASAALGTFWGRMIAGILAVVLLPLIIYIVLREKLSDAAPKMATSLAPACTAPSKPCKLGLSAV